MIYEIRNLDDNRVKPIDVYKFAREIDGWSLGAGKKSSVFAHFEGPSEPFLKFSKGEPGASATLVVEIEEVSSENIIKRKVEAGSKKYGIKSKFLKTVNVGKASPVVRKIYFEISN